jgi:putative peptidoglycan lipid II flippase
LGNAVAAFAPGLVGFALLTHLQRVLYAAHRPKAATIAATVAWSLVAGLSIILVLAALGGQTNTATTLLALSGASSIGMTVGGAAGLIAVRSALGSGALAGLARSAPVLAVGAALGGLSGRMLALNIAPSGAVSALGTVLLAALVAAIPVALAAVIAPGFRQALAATIRRQS